jgi:hypothetical protein|tara:strand:- start:1702 stop:2316 length:615 start_codon:yes stop_codon:yes gene_type:complete
MDKFLLFSTGSVVDYSNLSSSPLDDVAVFNSKHLSKVELTGIDVLTVTFDDGKRSIVDIKVKRGFHGAVIQSMFNAIKNSNESIITIADVDNNAYINTNIMGVTILTRTTYVQTLTNNSRTLLELPRTGFRSCIVANTDGVNPVALSLELYNGSEYTKILDQISVPINSSLVLNEDEISFDGKTYRIHATSGDADGQLTFTFNY